MRVMGCQHAVGHLHSRPDKKEVGRSLGFIPCNCCKRCLAVFQEGTPPHTHTHFCSFGTFCLVESKHLSVTTFKAFQRPQPPFGDKLILLKLSETLETPKEEGTPLSASLPDPFW